ncbi:hypothetical protein AMATHDRAFT_40507 [Amanita thiersii Skay4041]|uniref:G-protein coupled receptors family 1 profile domain-containing protein n=1 Tax=Amanita thiersii Skay4041 TaxID=703135 RepID=A0A2A9NTE3_9AGAR|nr:hypothetical protein AMATHDRAFT_40507 [Amanita thiersii Skay4041]
MISIAEVAVIATFVQAILYGLYISTLIYCLRWLLFTDEGWKLRKRPQSVMLGVTVVLFILSTSDLVLSLYNTIFFSNLNGGDVPSYIGVPTFIIENVTVVIVDCVLIYRCWVVYARSWRFVSLPLVLWVGDIGCLILFIYWSSTGEGGWGGSSDFTRRNRVLEAFYACTIATNVYATSAIIFKIWYVSRQSNTESQRLRFTIRVVAESGLLYTLTSIMLLCGTFFASEALLVLQALFTGINFSMTGIAFNLILIRVSQHRVQTENQDHMRKLTPLCDRTLVRS